MKPDLNAETARLLALDEKRTQTSWKLEVAPTASPVPFYWLIKQFLSIDCDIQEDAAFIAAAPAMAAHIRALSAEVERLRAEVVEKDVLLAIKDSRLLFLKASVEYLENQMPASSRLGGTHP